MSHRLSIIFVYKYNDWFPYKKTMVQTVLPWLYMLCTFLKGFLETKSEWSVSILANQNMRVWLKVWNSSKEELSWIMKSGTHSKNEWHICFQIILFISCLFALIIMAPYSKGYHLQLYFLFLNFFSRNRKRNLLKRIGGNRRSWRKGVSQHHTIVRCWTREGRVSVITLHWMNRED